jgi:hypothetical protein
MLGFYERAPFLACNTAAVAVAMALAGCDFSPKHLYPAPPPSPAQIAADFNSFETNWEQMNGAGSEAAAANLVTGPDTGNNIDVRRYVTSGYDIAEQQCLRFFTSLRQLRNDTEFYKDASRNALAAAGVITSLTGASAASLTTLFASTGLVPGIVDSFQKTFLLGEVGDTLFPRISSAMTVYRNKFPPDSPQVNRFNATMRVRQHATLCSVPYLLHVVQVGVQSLSDTSTPLRQGEGVAKAKDKGLTSGAVVSSPLVISGLPVGK